MSGGEERRAPREGTPANVLARFDVAADHPAFDGHFPGHPMLPGVVLLAAVIEAVTGDARLAGQVGAVPQPSVVKFLHPVGPGARLVIAFESTPRALKFSVRSDDGAFEAASGQFELAAPASTSTTSTSTSTSKTTSTPPPAPRPAPSTRSP